jgi:Flp pilus assembly protein TadD
MLAPVIGLVQVGNQALADRYTYLPAVGLFAAAAFGIAEAQKRFKISGLMVGLAGVLVLGGCVAVTEHQLTFWKNTETVFQRDAAVTRNNAPAHMTLAVFYKQQGRMEESQQEFQKALACFAQVRVPGEAGQTRPASAELLQNMGQIAEAKGDLAEAMENFRDAEQQDSNFFEVRTNLGSLLDKTGHSNQALTEFQAAVRLRANDPVARESLGTLLAKAGQFDEALNQYQAAAGLAPGDPQLSYLIGRTQLRRGQTADAVAAFQNALRLNPKDVPSLVFLARVLAADEASQNRNGPEAVKLAELANQLTGGTQSFVLGTLAASYAEAGRFDEARNTVQTAIKLNTGSGPETVASLQAQYELYQANQPYRESFASPATGPNHGAAHN